MRLMFWRRQRTESVPAVPENRAELDAQWVRLNELADALEEANAVAEAREVMRAKWEAMYREQVARGNKLAKERDAAQVIVRQHETSIATLNNAIQDWQEQLATEQKWTEALTAERNEARVLVAEMASEAVISADRIRVLETALSDAREQLRQERVERARGTELVTPESLETAMRRLEIPEQRKETDQ